MRNPAQIADPTPFAGPAPMPTILRASNYERATVIAREMAERHRRGDYNTAADAQSRATIDTLAGFVVNGEVVWPRPLVEMSGTTLRRAVEA